MLCPVLCQSNSVHSSSTTSFIFLPHFKPALLPSCRVYSPGCLTVVSGVEVLSEKPRTGARGRLGVAREPREREAIRQCFLFSNHLLITTRTHAGRSVAVCCNVTSISTLGTTYLQILIVDGKYCDKYTLYY